MSHIQEKIVLVGGGGGVHRVARFLKYVRPHITTIQTVFDSGGHSGQLRDERGVLPPGDIRRAILALADENSEHYLRELLSYRFPEHHKSSLDGATMGNLLLTALTDITGSLPQAINEMCRWYGVRGSVLPVSLDNAHIGAILSDGTTVYDEGNIDTRSIDDGRTIVDIFLEPKAHVYMEAYDALVNADKIILCPGDLYTSLLPNMLVEGFSDALRETKATVVYVANIMTKKSETPGFVLSDFLQTIMRYMQGRMIDVVIANSEELPHETRDEYQKYKSELVVVDQKAYTLVSDIRTMPLVDTTSGIVRHHERIAGVIADI